MFDRLYRRCLEACLIGGVNSPRGWGRNVRDRVLPLLGHPKLHHHAGIIREGFDRATDPISVFVIGEGNFGKSSLINALVKRPVAFVDFLPATWHITRYLPPAREDLFQIHYDPTAASAGLFEELGELRLHRAWSSGIVSFASVESLERVMAAEEARVKKTKGRSPVRQVLRTMPRDSATDRIEIVDTPGLNQIRDGTVDRETLDDFYHRADVVLWLLIADKLSSADTREALTAQSRYGKPILAVVNRADELKTPAHRSRAEAEVRRAFGTLVRDVVFVSAKHAFLAAQRGDEPGYVAHGLPELRRAVEHLAIEQGPRTKALSLYGTSRQAAREAGIILRREADVLEANLDRYTRNRATAESFTEKACKEVASVTAGSAHVIVLQATPVMQRTANFTGPDYAPVYDETAVKGEIDAVAQRVIEQLNEALRRTLESIQDEIATRHYEEQTYGGDATVKAHSSATSFSLRLDRVAHDVPLPAIPPVSSILDGIVAAVGNFIDWVKVKWYELVGDKVSVARVKEEGRQRKRKELHENYLRGLPAAAEQIVQRLRAAADEAIRETTTTLLNEVQRCFESAFQSENTARDNVVRFREQADAAVVPPALLHTLTRVLGAS